MTKKDKVLCILSGGIDSTVLLYDLIAQDYDVSAITFNYGQRHAKEIQYAIKTCTELGVKHKIGPISQIRQLLYGSSLTGGKPVPEGHYEDVSMKQTVVANRNSILINLAMAWAISKNIPTIAYGAHGGDHEIYPDCREIFVEKINDLAKVVHYWPLEVIAPYLTKRKEDIVKLGVGLDVPFENTWSCYKGGMYHCARCGTCTERKEAFKLAGVEDPTIYVK